MTPKQINAQLKELDDKLVELKRNDPAAYERMLAQLGDALEEFIGDLSRI